MPGPEPPAQFGARAVCPYLRVMSGPWRNAAPSRDHVCAADAVVVPVGLEAQRRLCLGTPGDCERFRSAAAARREHAPIWPIRPIARTAPVVVERGRAIGLPHVADGRTLGQVALALVMILAVVALIFARASRPEYGGTGTGPGSTLGSRPSASPKTSPVPSPTPVPMPTPTPGATATPKPVRTPGPSATQVATRTYRVRAGDTLSSIAAEYGTTVKVLAALNGISDPSLIRTGQVLKIP